MIKYEKKFYKCLGFQTQKKFNKPIFFYHVPKCAGTTFVVLISHLFQVTHRLNGPLFKDNDKGGPTGYEMYLKNENLINSNKLDFLYGHVPFEIHNKLNQNYLFVTTIREPVQRCISHYSWGLNRGYYSTKDDVEDLFLKNKIPRNTIVNQFSGIGLSKPDSDQSIELSLNNIVNKIDLIFDVDDVVKLLNLIISTYNLPNLFFQNQQTNFKKVTVSDKNIKVIKKYNQMDSVLYSKLLDNKIINNQNQKKLTNRKNKTYLYSSPDLLVNKQKTLLLNEKKIVEIETKIKKLNYQIDLI